LRQPHIAWIIESVLCSSLAHFALKMGASRFELPNRWSLEAAVQLIENGWLLTGLLLHALALALWIVGLKQVELSVAYPFIALGIGLTSALSWLYLSEAISWERLVGMALIASGVIVIART
jgi:multidrug transporter EmrE-like cation transporter